MLSNQVPCAQRDKARSFPQVVLPSPCGLRPRRLDNRASDAIRSHLLGLSDEDRFMRFSQVMGDAAVSEYASRIDFSRTLCLGIWDPVGTLAAFAQGFEYQASGARRMELSFTTASLWRRRGLASALFTEFASYACRARIDGLDLHCLARNLPMRGLLRSVNAATTNEDGDVAASCEVGPGSAWPRVDLIPADVVGALQ
jgi:hypothetical protein